MRAGNLRFLLGAGAALTAALVVAAPQAQTRSCQPPLRQGWSASFVAGCFDRNGKFAGGSQIMHLVPHKGALFAASGQRAQYFPSSENGGMKRCHMAKRIGVQYAFEILRPAPIAP
jgi:hypothetical protein